MTDDGTPMPDHDIDYLCWYVLSHLDQYAWPDEFAAGALAAREDIDREKAEHEWGYATAAFNMHDDFAEVLDRYVDVWDRANRYIVREDVPAFETLSHKHIADAGHGLFVSGPDRSPYDTGEIVERARELREQEDDQ